MTRNPGELRSRKALIVDDEPRIVNALTRLLRREGFEARAAHNGDEALAILPEFRPDLVLLDIKMPGMDGHEVCRRIRADLRFGLVKIILVSSNAKLEERLDGYRSGADDYITKPFDNDELIAKVRVLSRLKRAEEVDRIKGDLLALFAHETGTPLSIIHGSAEYLLQEGKLGREATDLVEIIFKNSNRLLDFAHKTMLLCKLKAGDPLRKVRASLGEHLEAAADALADAARGKEVRIDYGAEALEFEADWTVVGQVLGYLLDNAVKFSPPGGVVAITGCRDGDSCRIEVTDQGKGIAEEWRDKIFDEFAVSDIIHHHKGQGLSLAIARHVAMRHGGTIQAVGGPGRGATIVMQLPLGENATVPVAVETREFASESPSPSSTC